MHHVFKRYYLKGILHGKCSFFFLVSMFILNRNFPHISQIAPCWTSWYKAPFTKYLSKRGKRCVLFYFIFLFWKCQPFISISQAFYSFCNFMKDSPPRTSMPFLIQNLLPHSLFFPKSLICSSCSGTNFSTTLKLQHM